MLVASVFNALGLPKQALNVSFARLFIFYIPALWIGASTGEMIYAVVAASCANVLAGGFAWLRLSRYVKENIETKSTKTSCQSALRTEC
jgi:Na+-driven multidrug efflux pump